MKLLTVLMALLLFTGCTQTKQTEETVTEPVTDSSVTHIELNGDSATINGVSINESDYTWHVDPYIVHDEVKTLQQNTIPELNQRKISILIMTCSTIQY